MTEEHAWYSYKQSQISGKYFTYKDMNDNLIQVTEINHSKDVKPPFDDVIYMGLVKQYIQTTTLDTEFRFNNK